MSRKSFIYFVQESGTEAIKIGIAYDVKRRLGTMQCSNSRKLRLKFAWPCDSRALEVAGEKQLHHWLRKHKLRGEWFDISCLEHINKIVAHLDGEAKFVYYKDL